MTKYYLVIKLAFMLASQIKHATADDGKIDVEEAIDIVFNVLAKLVQHEESKHETK